VIKVIVVDGHEVVRRGIADLLADQPDLDVVGEARSKREALALVPRLRPDVVLTEALLSDGDGVTMCEELRTDTPGLRSLVFTGTTDPQILRQAIVSGIDGLVSKGSPGTVLLAALRQVAAGERALDPTTTTFATTHRLTGAVQEVDLLATLSPQQRALVDLIAQGKSNREIASALGIAEKTVKNYVSHLLLKTGFARRTEIAVYVARAAARREAEQVISRTERNDADSFVGHDTIQTG
jgi:DNA-binding NarL/FixJ family response regulator